MGRSKKYWCLSIIYVVTILKNSPNPRKFWGVLKTRLINEVSQLTTNSSQLKIKSADGKQYLTANDYKANVSVE